MEPKKFTYLVATFVRSGYTEAQEVKIDLLFLFRTSQKLTCIDDELYGFGGCTSCNPPILQIEFFSKVATKVELQK